MTRHLIRAEIDLRALAANVRELKKMLHPSARLMAVVKADGYGHGAVKVAETALSQGPGTGADILGVARIDEGVTLREAGITAPILIFGHTPPSRAKDIMGYDLTQTVLSLDGALELSLAAESFSKTTSVGKSALVGKTTSVPKTMPGAKPISVHVKIDTGMGRVGLLPDLSQRPGLDQTAGLDANPEFAGQKACGWGKTVQEISSISKLPNLSIDGIYTHFARADQRDATHAESQLDTFVSILDSAFGAGIHTGIRHAANSAAIMTLPGAHLDMARSGIAMYGLHPSSDSSPEMEKKNSRLTPVMSLKATVIHVKNVSSGVELSYGGTRRTDRPTVIATVSAGYADGVRRLLSNRGHMLVRGRRAPIMGRVCMDQTLLDTGHIPGVCVGDEVVVFGRQGQEEIGVDEIATLCGTIHYEIVSTIASRVPRVYIRREKIGSRKDGE